MTHRYTTYAVLSTVRGSDAGNWTFHGTKREAVAFAQDFPAMAGIVRVYRRTVTDYGPLVEFGETWKLVFYETRNERAKRLDFEVAR